MTEFIKGEQSLLYIKTLSDTTFVPVACLISNPISESSETIDTTTRDNAGWKTSKPTLQSYQIAVEGVMKKDDIDSGNNIYSFRKLRKLKRDRALFDWKIKTLSGWYVDTGKGFITDISFTDAVGEFINFSATIIGFGKPEESTDKIYILTEGNGLISSNNDIIKTN